MRTYLAPIAILIILISFVVFGIRSFNSQAKLGEPKIPVISQNVFCKDAKTIYQPVEKATAIEDHKIRHKL